MMVFDVTESQVLRGRTSRSAPRRARVVDDGAPLPASRPRRSTACCNRRPGVRAATVQRVLKAAGRARLPAAAEACCRRMAPQPLRLAFLLPAGTNRFLRMLGDTDRLFAGPLRALQRALPASSYIESFNPQRAGATRCCATAGACDGIAFMALEHPAVREAVDVLAERGRADGHADLGPRQLAPCRLCRAGQPRRRAAPPAI